MKKILLVLNVSILSCVLFLACDNNTSSNTNSSSSTDSSSPYVYSCNSGNHSWYSDSVSRQPTCQDSGLKVYKCTECGKTKTENIPALGHNFYYAWKTDATYHWHECSRCDAIDRSSHSWKVRSKTKVDASKTRTIYECTVCEKTKTVTSSASSSSSGHSTIR